MLSAEKVSSRLSLFQVKNSVRKLFARASGEVFSVLKVQKNAGKNQQKNYNNRNKDTQFFVHEVLLSGTMKTIRKVAGVRIHYIVFTAEKQECGRECYRRRVARA